MGHLTTEALARLLDGPSEPDEIRHLANCEACSAELEELRGQTEALGNLPEIRPPIGDWRVLEARLRSEGLVRDPGLFRKLGIAETPRWMRAAAAVVLFLGGVGVGATAAAGPTRSPGSPSVREDAPNAVSAASVQDAARDVRVAEERYVSALTAYREALAREGHEDFETDPNTRIAALEYLLAASKAAIRQAPADPFFNGLLASTMAEREAVLRRISSGGDNWF